MPTPQRKNHRANGHSDEVGLTPDAAQCPYCGGLVSRAEYRRIKQKIEGEERARIVQVEQTLTARFAREKAAAETQAKALVDKARRDAARSADQQVKELKASLEATVAERVAAQRAASEKLMAEAVAAERTKAYAERMKLDAQLADLQRKLQRRTSNDLGDGAEIDLVTALEAVFGHEDKISRVGRAVKGPDIIIEVFNREIAVGSIIIDSKNYARSRWSNALVGKIKADQVAENADYAVLSSTAFPKGQTQLAVQEGVIIAHPQRVVAVVQLLRRQLISNHALRLSAEQRDTAASRLLTFIISSEASDMFSALEKATDSMFSLEHQEIEAQQAVHRKRGELIRDVTRFHENMTTAIDMLVAEPVAEGVAA
jgi:hypothetical protein